MAKPIEVSVQLVDAFGRTTNKRFGIVETTPSDAITDAVAFVALLDAVTKMGVTGAQLILPITVTPSAAAAGSNKDAGMTLTGVLYNKSGQRGSIKIPDPIAACLQGDGSINLADTDVAALIAEFVHTTGTMYLSDGETIDPTLGWVKGKLDSK